MQKYLRRISVSLVVISLSAAIIALLAFYQTVTTLTMEAINVYATAAFVAYIDQESETVTFEDADGNQWSVDGVGEWEKGGLAVLVMQDSGTHDDLTDDEILTVEYSGFAVE